MAEPPRRAGTGCPLGSPHLQAAAACYHGGEGITSGMSFGELLFLAMLALLVFGPRKLPEMARAAAKIMAELRKASNEFRFSLEDEIRSIEVAERSQKRLQATEPVRPAVLEGTVARDAAREAEAEHEAEPETDVPGSAGEPAAKVAE